MGDISLFSLFDEGDLRFGGLFGGPLAISPSVPASDLDLEFEGLLWDMGGSSVGVSEYVSDGGLSPSGEKTFWLTALGGKEGKDLSSMIEVLGGCWRCL